MSSQDETKSTKPRNPRKGATIKKVVWQGFVECRLSDEDKEDFEHWFEANTLDPMRFLYDFVRDGFKVSLTPEVTKGSYTATITDNDPTSPQAGWALSAFGDSLEKAIMVLVYKHTVLLQDGWVIGAKDKPQYG